MDADYWNQKWQRGDIAFHEGEVNALLQAHFARLSLPRGSRIFVPLCGKTRDIAWLLAQGYKVVGAELSERAVTELFAELGIEPTAATVAELALFQAVDIDIFVGDIFVLDAILLGAVDAVYDRAALVALPPAVRDNYTAQLLRITKAAPQLLITLEYDQNAMAGPPFSITQAELERHYATTYQLDVLGDRAVEGGLKGLVNATEVIRLLRPV